MENKLITVRKSTFDWAYSAAREAIFEQDMDDSIADGLATLTLPEIINTTNAALQSYDHGFSGVWKLLTAEQQIGLVFAVTEALYRRQFCDVTESLKIDRHMRASELREAKQQPGFVSGKDFIYTQPFC